MSPETVIRVERLSKQYTLGETGLRADGLRHVLHDFATAPFRLLKRKETSESGGDPGTGFHPIGSSPANGQDPRASRTFHALKDVTFDVKRGEVVGIIGHNGAGKSTLLKILSRITEPTTGRVGIKGRVASLLEVGTGFHPELTGRENIYLNGSILGMSRSEIATKFDEIVSFAEVEQFLDTPVKRYSTGMYVRLAFAVAAHLQPEILVIDEVLAVGDAAFQKKCLGKMGDVAKEGRTVLFVSHNMAAVLSLCNRAILLESGNLTHQGRTQDVMQRYLHSAMSAAQIPLDQRQDRGGDGSAKIILMEVESTDSDKVIRSTSRLKITVHYRSETVLNYPKFVIGIYDYTKDTGICLLDSDAVGGIPETLPREGSVSCFTDPLNVTAGRCCVNVALFKGGVMADFIGYAAIFDVAAADVYGSGKEPSREWMLCLLKHEWSVEGSRP